MRLEPLDPLSSFLFIEGGSICIENLLKLEEEGKKESLNLQIMERRRNLLKINIYIV